jgi:protein-glutamine gamma-glutamyltransferase
MLIPRKLLLLWMVLQSALLILLQQAFSWWIMALFASLLGFRALQLLSAKSPLSLKVINALAAAICIALLANLKQAGVLHFMLQILLLAAILRLLALRHANEARQLVWVHYFLIACCFILHQDMLIAAIILLGFALNLYCHFYLFAPASAQLNWLHTARSFLIILPLWLAMFLLFPRLPPFWQIPSAKVASTGLSDTLDPGSIEQLVQDDSLAFRVEFDGAMPARQQLYWRSHLYEDFDGRRWQVNPLRQLANKARISPTEPAEQNLPGLSYRIIAEASQQHNLFALSLPLTSSDKVFIAASGLISSVQPVTQRLNYQVSGVTTPVAMHSKQERQLNLLLPDGNPQTLQFAQQLAQQYTEPAALIQALKRHFNQQAYFYSLTPPALGQNSVDQFLFETRSGFCSHYASATALILRAAGIPARVVGGYQGGIWHAEQGYLAVRQREAHAWVEYLHQAKWQMFDPTAAVAPERILDGLESSLTLEQQDMLLSGWTQIALLQQLRLQLMHLDYYWSVWVLGFNDNDQQALWHSLRQHIKVISITLAGITALLILLSTLYWWRRRPVNTAPAATQLLQRGFAPLLAQKPAQQSLASFLTGVKQRQPAHLHWLQQLISLYEQSVFRDDAAALKQLQQLLKQHKAELALLNRCVENT